ncbi:hypothetical protein CASFOL_013019 [Castilleja foliolosa]|uniref:F-box domain-containing protein n=1 Tax=Castilleja foliolosa TaxID=1961234 RepID=A0ABD3DMK7_9LAMI
MKKQAIDREGSMDRISELPQHLLHDILCLLSQKEALQTSVLSKSCLVLCGRILIQTPIDNVILCKHLQKLDLAELHIEDELNMILSSCCLIESFVVSNCRGLRNIKLDNQISLKSFDFDSYESLHEHNDTSIEINSPTLETVSIIFANSLCGVMANGFEQFQLSSRSIKNFEILYDGFNPLEAVIDAPSLVRFEYFGDDIPRSISFQATASEWKSKIDVRCDTTVDDPAASLWCLKLYDILKALSKSKISLRIRQTIERNGNIEEESEEEEEAYGVLCEPVVVERLALGLRKSQNPSSCFLKNLKRICLARKWVSEDEISEEETE